MPHHVRHKEQKSKNWLLLALLLGLIGIVYAVTIIKMGQLS